MIYTSGTTGHPKGVRRNAPTPEQTANAERMRALIYGLKPNARVILPGPRVSPLAAAMAVTVTTSFCAAGQRSPVQSEPRP